jgi:hypothetical protein
LESKGNWRGKQKRKRKQEPGEILRNLALINQVIKWVKSSIKSKEVPSSVERYSGEIYNKNPVLIFDGTFFSSF